MSTKESKKHITDFYNGKVFINFSVLDFEDSIKFYQQGLGLQPTDFSQSHSPDEVGLFEFALPAKGAILSVSEARDGKVQTNESLVIMVTEIDKFKETLADRGIESTDITDVPDLLSFLIIKDPAGNKILFMSEPRKTST